MEKVAENWYRWYIAGTSTMFCCVGSNDDFIESCLIDGRKLLRASKGVHRADTLRVFVEASMRVSVMDDPPKRGPLKSPECKAPPRHHTVALHTRCSC